MKTRIKLLATAALATGLVQAAASSAHSKVDRVEGELWAADCLVTSARADCTRNALQKGEPAGVFAKGKFTMLLVDGRILARACDMDQGKARIRAFGKLHAAGQAMTPLSIEAWCADEWRPLALPQSGTTTDSAGGGDE